MNEEELKLRFESEFRNLFESTFTNSGKILTRANFKTSANQMTVIEVKELLAVLLRTCINTGFEEIKIYHPRVELDEEKFVGFLEL